MNNAIEVHGLTKTYRGSSFKLDDISFSLPKGSIMGFIGENGSGKTTTIKAILNLFHYDSGDISILGMDSQKRELEIKQQIGVVFDEGCFYDTLRAKDVSLIMRNIYKNWNDKTFLSYLEKFDIPMNITVKQYSRGMKMKLSIAVALSHAPKLLILDEATSGLDPVVRNEILDEFLEFIQDEEHSIFISSHITSDLEKIADYITFIHKGKLVLSDSKDTLLNEYGLLKCGNETFHKIDRSDIIGSRTNQFGYEVLVSDRRQAKRKYPDCVIDHVSLEEIMLYYVKGGR